MPNEKELQMYYTITNTIGTSVDVDGQEFICGNLYANKTKAPKDADYLLAFSKAEKPIADKIWRFDGKADIDFTEFCYSSIELFISDCNDLDVDIDDFTTNVVAKLDNVLKLAWKSERINIQAQIRPSKDSKKAIKMAKRAADIKDIENRFAAGEIDAAEFGRLAMELASQI